MNSESELSMLTELAKEYRLRFAHSGEYRRQVWEAIVKHSLQRWIPPDARVLDLGCGWGEFINCVEAAQRIGMDLNSDAPRHLAADVRFMQHDCTRQWPLDDASLDVVFTSNLLEHLPDKAAVRAALAEAYRCLCPGGRLICLGPNIRFIHGAYWDFWDHFVPLTDRSLCEALRLTDFEIEACRDRFLPYSMSQGRQPPLFLVKLYLQLPWIWKWMGQQFLVVARKPQRPA